MKTALGVFAHVDAGKTTFCENLLYLTNTAAQRVDKPEPAALQPGRVDHGTALMDHNEIEKRRGITIFTDIASFSHAGKTYYLIDTPGHIDFSAEMERTISVLDAAVLVISAVDGVQSHTVTICRLLREKEIPIYLFINKTDQIGADITACLDDIKAKLRLDCRLLNDASDMKTVEFTEWLCDYDERLTDHYLENGYHPAYTAERLKASIKSGAVNLAVAGSALRQTGVLDLIEVIGQTFSADAPTETAFSAQVFKVRYDQKGTRVTFLKCLSGTLKTRDELPYSDGEREKVNELRDYQGKSYHTVNAALPGDIIGVTGLHRALPGMRIGQGGGLSMPVLRPALKSAVLWRAHAFDTVMDCLKKLEAQDPLLSVSFEPKISEINIHIMGKIQLEVLKELISEQFGLNVDFGECDIVYMETVAEPVMGYGHFEPLRHYAEVHLKLLPSPNGGISFKSEIHTDQLAKQYQNLIRYHLLEHDHKGVLTGSSLTDICFVLTNGAIHLKHTEGGDLREAAFRAVRQGLEKAASVLLEPFYEFVIDVDMGAVGRVLSDITARHGVFEPPEASGDRTQIKGSGPVATLLDYPAQLLSFTKGTSAISMRLLGYFPCHNPAAVIEKIGYQKERDLENVSSSVFCAKGAGFEVKWHEAEAYMHLL